MVVTPFIFHFLFLFSSLLRLPLSMYLLHMLHLRLTRTKVTSNVGLVGHRPQSQQSLRHWFSTLLKDILALFGFSHCRTSACLFLDGVLSGLMPVRCFSQRNLFKGNKHFSKRRSAINQNSDFYLASNGSVGSKNLKLAWVVRA